MAWCHARAGLLLVWWAVPVTLVVFFLRFIVRHDAAVTFLQVVVAAVSVRLAITLRRMLSDTLRGAHSTRLPWRKWFFGLRVWVGVLRGALAGAFMTLFAIGCFYGEPFLQPGYIAAFTGNESFGRVAYWTWHNADPQLLNLIGWTAFADLREAELSRKPDDWDGRDLSRVRGARLQGAVLKAAEGFRAFAPKTNFRGARLERASFWFADLRGADFSEAHLEQADLSFADLRSATFAGAYMVGTKLVGANIEKASLAQARGLDGAEVWNASNWFLAHLGDQMLEEVNVCSPDFCDHSAFGQQGFLGPRCLEIAGYVRSPDFSGANLQHADLSGKSLEGADLAKADLRYASLHGTKFGGADLAGADLRGVNLGDGPKHDLAPAYGLTRAQIESALVDDHY